MSPLRAIRSALPTLGVCFALSLVLTAEAQTVHGVDTLQGCADDVGKLCGDVDTGGGGARGKITACMAEHRDQLSQLCRQAIGSGVATHQIDQADAAEILGGDER